MVEKRRADSQLSGLAGEFFVAAELLKREIQTSVTFGNAKAIDLLAHNARTSKSFTIQVKAIRTNNYFLIDRSRIEREHVYTFVLLGKPDQHPRYFIVPGVDLIEYPNQFGKGFADPKMPGILPKDLATYEDNWAIFEIV